MSSSFDDTLAFDAVSRWGTWKARPLAEFCLKWIGRLPNYRCFRKLAFVMRKPVKRGRHALYDREIWGLRLRLSARGNLSEQRWLTMPNFHDVDEREAIRMALGPGSVFLDVGANAGFYTFWALSQHHAGLKVIAIEPNEVMLERLRYNLATNRLTSAVTLFSCAATPEPCEVVIQENSTNLGETSTRTEGGGRRVPGRPLLELLQEARITKVDAMKIDIEGFEVPVMEAFFKTAPRPLWPRLIIGEIVGLGGGSLKKLLVSHGYQIDRCTKMNGILSLPDQTVASH